MFLLGWLMVESGLESEYKSVNGTCVGVAFFCVFVFLFSVLSFFVFRFVFFLMIFITVMTAPNINEYQSFVVYAILFPTPHFSFFFYKIHTYIPYRS